MPIHDWSKVPSGLFHDFHQTWSIQIKAALNAGLLPKGLSALVEQRFGPKEPDVLAVESRSPKRRDPKENLGGTATLERPKTGYVYRSDKEIYASKGNRIVVKHHLGRTVAVIEIVSPGNKNSKPAIREFLEKTSEYIRAGIHVLVIDLFPPSKRDPLGIHSLIWEEIGSDDVFVFPHGKDRILASYEAEAERAAFVEAIGIGDEMPDMPLFLSAGLNVRVPLETTYATSWATCTEVMQEAVITGKLPDEYTDEE
jgi:hypothetical protein